jgi:hypothetical protein
VYSSVADYVSRFFNFFFAYKLGVRTLGLGHRFAGQARVAADDGDLGLASIALKRSAGQSAPSPPVEDSRRENDAGPRDFG